MIKKKALTGRHSLYFPRRLEGTGKEKQRSSPHPFAYLYITVLTAGRKSFSKKFLITTSLSVPMRLLTGTKKYSPGLNGMALFLMKRKTSRIRQPNNHRP